MAIENDKDFQEWELPDFEDNESIEEDELDLFGRAASWYQPQPEKIQEPKEEGPKPLTLDDIESIRASAYEDGFNEGKESGFAQGLEEGKLQGLSEGHQEGLKQGLEEGLSEGKVKVDVQTLHWEQLVSRLHRPLEKLDENIEFQLIKLSTSLAEQMARCEVTVNQQVILQALKQGIQALPVNDQTIVISLNPDDLIFVQEAFSEEECNKRGWDLRAEPTLLRGDCQIQTQSSSIDYTFSSRVEQVLKHFLKENYQNSPEVSDDGDISNDQPLEYEMKNEADVAAEIAQSDNVDIENIDLETMTSDEIDVESKSITPDMDVESVDK